MFNFTFSFAAALWALPLMAAPILLHLLFKQKSPVVPFSTLRFIKLSIQRTAARKRVQKWLLLACRALLIALIIWAIAQPAKKLTSSWLGTGGSDRSTAAVIVVDTSYSMQLPDGQVTLLSKADLMVQDLLRNQLAGAKVAIFRSMPTVEEPERFKDAGELIAQWTPLQPQPSPKPLVDRVASAVDLLDRDPTDQKWLVVISDFQSHEFPHGMPAPKDGRTVLLDLHLKDPRTAGITGITLNPAQPIPGLPTQAMITVTGQAGDARPKQVTVTMGEAGQSPDQNQQGALGQPEVMLDSTGRGSEQVSLLLPAKRWLLIKAELTGDDGKNWNGSRTQLIEVPPQQKVSVLQQTGSPDERRLRLLLDPYTGQQKDWPVQVIQPGPSLVGNDAVVMDLAHWPDARQAAQLKKFASAGRTVILFLSPGLERSWPSLSQAEQDDLAELLPSPPIQRPGTAIFRAAVVDATDPLLEGLVEEKYQLNAIIVRQLVPLAAEGRATTILNAVPADPTPGSRTQGLLYRKSVGQGVCYTFATTPDPQYTNMTTHPTFLPLFVRMALKPLEQSAGQNVELGADLVLDGSRHPENDLFVTNPNGERTKVPATFDGDARQFILKNVKTPGVYIWRTETGTAPVAMTNVQYPASESDLTFRSAASVAPPGTDTVIATSMAELSGKITDLTAPRPQWSTPLAIVMFLLCLEALMGSWSKLWKPAGMRAFVPGMKAETAG